MKQTQLLITGALILCCMTGCRMISKAEYKQLQSPESPYITGAAEFFDKELTPYIESNAIPLNELISKIKSYTGFDEACSALGYREGPDLQCNFAVKVSGSITEIKDGSRRGSITITDVGGKKVKIQIGPVIMGTSLRDVQNKVGYKEFNDQTVYGEFGKHLNSRSIEISSQNKFSVGDSYEVVGAISSWDVPTSVQITPVKYIKQ